MDAKRHLVRMGLAIGLALSAQALAAPPAESKDLVLRGDAQCTRCHGESDAVPMLALGLTRHGVKADRRTPTCTSCHGDSVRHANAMPGPEGRPRPDVVFHGATRSTPEAQDPQCLSCHENGARMHWEGSRHASESVACASCHTVHAARDPVLAKLTQPDVCFSCHKAERAEANRISHHPILEGKVACSDCHAPHGSDAPKMLVKNTVNETCWQCHAEKRGPFLWEHAVAMDDCMNCHAPHGSTHEPLLRARSPWLCQECHGDGPPHSGSVYSAAGLPGGPVANVNNTGGTSGNSTLGVVNPVTGARVTQNSPPVSLAFGGCTDCHATIHGSNHPAGNRFLR